MKNSLLLFCLLLLGVQASIAQTRPVLTGSVYDDREQPLAYVNVIVINIKITGASTRLDGTYKIVLPDIDTIAPLPPFRTTDPKYFSPIRLH